jgi:peptidoglycan-associated lipoprotein
LLVAAAAPSGLLAQTDDQERVQHEITRAKIFREAYPLIIDVDNYCGIYLHEGDLPELRVVAAEREYEKIMYADSDIIFLNQGKAEGVEIGQVFLAVELGNDVGGFGRLAMKRGRVHVVFVEDHSCAARVEKSCGRVMVGNFLFPFEEKETLLGKDLGYESYSTGGSGPFGNIIYLERDYNQIGSGGYAIIDLGDADGIQVGQQMTIYRTIKKGLPDTGIGNVVVTETKDRTATIKVLSCSDAVRRGMRVQGLLASERTAPEEAAAAPAQETPSAEKAAEPAVKPPLSEEGIYGSKSLEQLNQEQPLKPVFFDFDKYFIREDAKPVLEEDARWLLTFKTARIQIEGHADERGTEAYNLALGEKRARSTSDYLFTLGVAKERMEILSFGESRPLDLGKNREAWAKNRRVQFTIIAK